MLGMPASPAPPLFPPSSSMNCILHGQSLLGEISACFRLVDRRCTMSLSKLLGIITILLMTSGFAASLRLSSTQLSAIAPMDGESSALPQEESPAPHSTAALAYDIV